MYTHSKETQSKLTPQEALDILQEGNERFVRNLKANRDFLQQVNQTRDGQFPFATILSCMDSRTSAEQIFDQGLGDIFSIRIAGNVLNDDILGSMEFATKIVGTKLILVLGHTRCGAIVGACNQVHLGKLTQLLEKIQPAIDSDNETPDSERTGSNPQFVQRVTEKNVYMTMEAIREQSSIIREPEESGALKIAGGIYDVQTGAVTFLPELVLQEQ